MPLIDLGQAYHYRIVGNKLNTWSISQRHQYYCLPVIASRFIPGTTMKPPALHMSLFLVNLKSNIYFYRTVYKIEGLK